MELTHLRYFYNVARAQSFVRGARLSHVTPPAVSKAVKKLEGELDTQLFTRTTRHAALTETGEILLAHCRDVFRCMDYLQRALDEAKSMVCGELRIGASEVFSAYQLPAALCRLLERYPHVLPKTYEMLPDALEQQLVQGEIDVAFTTGEPERREIEYETVGKSPGVLVCGRGHELYGAPRITPSQAQRLPFVVPQFFRREFEQPVDQYPEHKLPRHVGATTELMQMAVRMTVAGGFLGYFPEIAIQHHLDDGSLHQLRGIKLGPPFVLKALLRRGVKPKAAVRVLIDELTAS